MKQNNQNVPIADFCYESKDLGLEKYVQEQINKQINKSLSILNIDFLVKIYTEDYNQLDKSFKKCQKNFANKIKKQQEKKQRQIEQQKININQYKICKYKYQEELLLLAVEVQKKFEAIKNYNINICAGGLWFNFNREKQKLKKQNPRLQEDQINKLVFNKLGQPELADLLKTESYNKKVFRNERRLFNEFNCYTNIDNLLIWFSQQHNKLIQKNFVEIPNQKGWNISNYELPDAKEIEDQLFCSILRVLYQKYQKKSNQIKQRINLTLNTNNNEVEKNNIEDTQESKKTKDLDQITFAEHHGFKTPSIKDKNIFGSSKKKIYINKSFNKKFEFKPNIFDYPEQSGEVLEHQTKK